MKLKIGIVGFNDVGKMHYSELRRSNKFDVCGIFDENGDDEYSRVPFYNDFKKFMKETEPQVLVLCLKENEILNAFLECVKYTKNILIASHLCNNLNDIRQMRYTANANKINSVLCFSDRFNPVITSLKKALLKEDEIYSIDIFHSKPKFGCGIISELCVFDIYLANVITDSPMYEFGYSFTNKTNQKSSDNGYLHYKSKNQILVSIVNSLSSSIEQFNIRVGAKSGVYFADLLNLKLHQLNQNGQINLKVNNEDSELRVLYDEFYDFCVSGEQSALVTLDDMIKIKELFA